MLKVVECIYRTTEKPENPEKYQKLQVLAQIKIDMVWNDNTELQSAIDKVENYLVYDEPCNIEEMKKLAQSSWCEKERQAFRMLLSIVWKQRECPEIAILLWIATICCVKTHSIL